MTGKIPWPTMHTGLTPDDIPYDYSAFPTIWDDGSGYEPMIVGRETDEAGRPVILVALSPGRVLPVTLVSAGQAVEDDERALLRALGLIRTSPVPPGLPTPQRPAWAPDLGLDNREAQ